MRHAYLLCFAMLSLGAGDAAAAAIPIVVGGAARSVILVPEGDAAARDAAVELCDHLARATGAVLPIHDEADAGQAQPSHTRIWIGTTERAASLGLRGEDLPAEHYRVTARDGEVFFLGHDLPGSSATFWAVDAFLDRQLGVRWLWPGELGTHVPRRDAVTVPADLDLRGGPDLQQRHLRSRREGEVQTWLRRHQMGSRMSFHFGHAFLDWWEKYHEAHPDYFAVPPAGVEQPWPRAERVKLNVGNPAVVELIVAEWQAAGAPDNWNVCPNDGSGWDTGPASRALDPPELADVSDEDIWRGRANLTPRFVRFWNRILVHMRPINPDVTISSYIYSAYRQPPPADVPLEPGMVLGIVHTYDAYDLWQAWHDAGARLVLRPNWWHMGAVAPHLPLHRAGDFFRFAHAHSMIGFDFDSLMGAFGTQGPYYYLIARLSVRPELTVDQVLDEYASAFGAAAPAIRDYLAYWEDFTERAAFPVPAGGPVSQNPDGLYERAVREHDLPLHPLSGSWRVMPYLYTDEVCAGAWAVLDRARGLLPDSTGVEAQRVAFLADGLRHLEETRDVVAMAYDPKYESGEARQAFVDAVVALERWRVGLTRRNVVWGDVVRSTTQRRGVSTMPEDFDQSEVDLEGL